MLKETTSPSPAMVLDSIVSELESLQLHSATVTLSDLVALHGALLVFALDGRAELLPALRFPLGSRRLLENRVLREAQHLCRSRTPAEAVELANVTIEQLVYVIDADLALLVA